MKSRELMLGVGIVLVFFVGWLYVLNYINRVHPEWNVVGPATRPATQPMAERSTAPSVQTRVESQAPSTQSSGSPAAASSTGPSLAPIVVRENARPIRLGSEAKEDKNFAMRLSLTPRGAGIESVTLNDFKQVVTEETRYEFQKPVSGFEDATRALATRNITINGQTIDLINADWSLDSSSPTRAIYILDVGSVVQIRKTFEIFERSGGPPGSAGFEVSVRYAFKNLSSAPVTVKSAFNGVGVPPREIDRGPDLQIMTGYNDDANLSIDHAMLEGYKAGQPQELIKSDKGLPMLWTGACSVYFNAILRPIPLVPLAPKSYKADFLSSVKVEALNPDSKPEDRHVAMTVETSELKLEAGESKELPMQIFFGPRKRKLLQDEYYSAFPLSYDQSLIVKSGLCGFCTFQPVINVLVAMLGAFHWIFRDWGLAIICLVLVVRTALHPISKKSQVNMMKMGKMGPEAERLKKKYGDNKDELNKQMMELYKQQGIAPVLGCLPMFLQMPIWIALWSSLQSTFELRQEPFLHFHLWGNHLLKLSWINDLAKPDHLLIWQPIELFFGIKVGALNLLPILLAVVFFLQQKYTPKPPAATPEQAQQQKMMQWMSLLFPIFLYNGPSGLNLYIFTSTTLGIFESRIIRKHIKEREEAEKSGVVIVDARPTRGSRRKDEGSQVPVKKDGIMGFIADLQRRADEVRRPQGKK